MSLLFTTFMPMLRGHLSSGLLSHIHKTQQKAGMDLEPRLPALLLLCTKLSEITLPVPVLFS